MLRPREPIDYAAPRGGGWITVSFADAALNRFDAETIDSTIVLVGESRSIVDQFTMPLADGLNPGLYYHANVIAQILDGRRFETAWRERPLLDGLVGGLGLAAGLFAWYPRRWWTRRRGSLALAGYVVAGVMIFLGGWSLAAVVLFHRGVLAPFVAPLIVMGMALGAGWVAQWIIVSANTRRLMERNQRIEALFGRNVSQSVLNALKADPAGIMETRVREVSVLFCDLRGFTAAAANLPPERVAEMLNEYFNHITAAVIAHDGFVDKFVGDEIMAVFAVPLPQDDHADRAVRAAVQIKRELLELNEKRALRGQESLNCGVGIHTGPAAAGHIGSADRSNYTVVGATVNLAARIQGLSKGGEILISQTTRERLVDATHVALWNKVDIRGLQGAHEIHEVKV
jgi:adenylate cyclase